MKKNFFLLLLTISASTAYATTRVVSISIENGSHIPIKQIREVLPVKTGDIYDPQKTDQAISYLKKWGRFSLVDSKTTKTTQGVELLFIVKEGLMISGLNIYGNYPYLSTHLRRILTLHTSDLYDEERAREQSAKLESFYERKGYEGTKVSLTPKINKKKGTIDLIYRISRGKRYRINTVTVHGNTVFPHGYFVSKLNPLLAYEPSRFRKDLEDIRRDYQNKGYLSARVTLKDLGKDKTKHQVNPVIEVTERKHVTILFEGNHRVSRRTFKSILPLFTEGGYDDYDINASADAVRNDYHHLGFQNIYVATEKKDLGDNEMLIRFKINEGVQTQVKKINIIHTDEHPQISNHSLKKELDTRENTITQRGYYQPRLVGQDFKRLPKILQEKGALEGQVLDHETTFNFFKDKAAVSFKIEEGKITKILKIQFSGNTHFTERQLKKQLSLHEGQSISQEKLQRDQEALTFLYANQGFPYIQVTHELIPSPEGDKKDEKNKHVTLMFHFDEGAETLIGEVLIVGNERSQKKAVLQGLLLKTGDLFSYRKILKSESELRRTGSYRNVNIETIGLTEKEPVIHLIVRLEEYRPIVVDLGATYDTDNSFTGDLSLTDVNILGTNKRSIIQLTGGRDLQSGKLILKDPYFFGYHVEGSLGGKLERQIRPGFKTVEGGTSVAFLKEFNVHTSFLGRYELTRTFFSDVTDTTGITEADHTISKFSFSLSYDKRNSFSDPQRGYVAFAGIDVSNKLIASAFNFIQPKGYVADYLRLNGRMTLLNYVRLEGIKVFGPDNLARDQKLFLGGDYSVRGFAEDTLGPIGSDGRPAGGQLLISETTELQTRVAGDFKFAIFLDNGSLTDNFSELSLSSLRHTAGAGLRYITPIGPLRLDYGFKLDRKAGETLGRLHFAFGYAF